ncbi:hypothetical protein ANANG_G00094080 [Anguilla anguilla]|uniref:Protein ECT2 n=1 Tax=Anguilla anguilla TaxID=7936 RepID=A0A9D3MQJ4_ANGAN|nr:hypothetical protein ANANG_G00094080 [Anguilla anguilla]
MADSSTVTLGPARSLLVDSSVYDSRMAETSKDQPFLGLTPEDAADILPPVETRVVLVGDAGNNEQLVKALEAIKIMEVPVVKIKGGEPGSEGEKLIKSIVNMDIHTPCIKTSEVAEFGDGENAEFETVFVLTDFTSPDYGYLYKKDNRIIGPPVVLHCAAREEPLPFSSRPLYCTAMLNLSLCFTGFRRKEEVVNLVSLVHHMGGAIRKDFSAKVTHLIAHSTHGEKYRLAVCMGTPILTPQWIHQAWEHRDQANFAAGDEEFRSQFKVPPFQDCVLSFLGFSPEDKANMEERTLKHGGRYLEVGDEKCTHMVVEENSIKELPFVPSKRLYVVKQEWFWGSIQMDARAGESMYFYEKPESPVMKKAVSLLSLTTPTSNRKRRRLRDTLAQLSREAEISPFPPRKRQSAEHSLSMGSLLDISNTPETSKALGDDRCRRGGAEESSRRCRRSGRGSRFRTEAEGRFKHTSTPKQETGLLGSPAPSDRGGAELASLTPPLQSQRDEVTEMEVSLGSHWLAESERIPSPRRAPPPAPQKQSARWQVSKELYQTESNYVGILATVLQEVKTIFSSIPEIYEVHTRIKADLEELVMDWSEDKSVGDIILKYSKDLIKAYPPFVNFFEMSKETIVRCEKQKPRFHAFLKINQAKPECGRQTLVELLIRPVQRLPSVALLLNDIKKHTADDNPDKAMLERAIGSLKEVMMHINEDKRKTEGQKQIFDVVYEVDGCPANLLSSHRSLVHRVETIALGDKPCDRGEHVTLFLFNDCLEIARKRHKIRRVLDLRDTEDCRNAFALVVHPPTEQENLLFSFQLVAEDAGKAAWLKTLCRHVADTICKADAEELIQCTDPESVHVSTKDMESTLSRASQKDVTRAFSFTKTPKRVIQRAFMASSTPDDKSPGPGSESRARLGSSATLSMPRSTSTFSINSSGKSAVVQRSNSFDPAPRPRVPVCIRAPSSPDRAPCSSAQAAAPAPPTVTLAPPPRACQDPVPSAELRKAPRRETLL